MKFEQAVENYLNAKISGRRPIRPNTLEGYLSAIRCHLIPKWTGREIESITSDEMQAWVCLIRTTVKPPLSPCSLTARDITGAHGYLQATITGLRQSSIRTPERQ